MKVVFDENFFDEIDHFHPNFDESVPNLSFSRCQVAPCWPACVDMLTFEGGRQRDSQFRNVTHCVRLVVSPICFPFGATSHLQTYTCRIGSLPLGGRSRGDHRFEHHAEKYPLCSLVGAESTGSSIRDDAPSTEIQD